LTALDENERRPVTFCCKKSCAVIQHVWYWPKIGESLASITAYHLLIMHCIVSIHLYSTSRSACQSEALPVRETQREENMAWLQCRRHCFFYCSNMSHEVLPKTCRKLFSCLVCFYINYANYGKTSIYWTSGYIE